MAQDFAHPGNQGGARRTARDAGLESPPADLEALREHVSDTALLAYESDDLTLEILRTVSDRTDDLDLDVTGDEAALHGFRAALRRWLTASGASRSDVHDVTLAANEAVQNAIEHAHGLSRRAVEVRLQREAGRITVTVRDEGTWKRPRRSDRGRGLPLMRALMDSVEIERGQRGTTVTLRRALASRQPGVTSGTNRTGSSSSRTTPEGSARERTSRSSPREATGATSRPPRLN
jgi:anti-sigma regulatory factor (Ser/Thr protein kinase)